MPIGGGPMGGNAGAGGIGCGVDANAPAGWCGCGVDAKAPAGWCGCGCWCIP